MSLTLSPLAVGRMAQSAARLRRAIEDRTAASDAILTTTFGTDAARDAEARVRDADLEVRLAAIDLLCTVEVEVVDEARFLAEDAAAELGGAA